ncbi:hypothetical protein D3C76_1333390 [compost metagenome]
MERMFPRPGILQVIEAGRAPWNRLQAEHTGKLLPQGAAGLNLLRLDPQTISPRAIVAGQERLKLLPQLSGHLADKIIG